MAIHEINPSQLLPGHDALIKLVKELGISSIVADEFGGMLINYHDSRLDMLYVRGAGDSNYESYSELPDSNEPS